MRNPTKAAQTFLGWLESIRETKPELYRLGAAVARVALLTTAAELEGLSDADKATVRTALAEAEATLRHEKSFVKFC